VLIGGTASSFLPMADLSRKGGRRIGSLSSPAHWFAPKKERRSYRRPFDFHTNKCDRIKAILGIKSGISSGRNPRGYGLSGIDRRLDDTRRVQ
jgi:predicted urease superfamily metal-dependent hydrolase